MADLSVLYPNTTDCFALEKQLNVIRNDMNHFYSNLNDKEGDRRKSFLDIKVQQFNLMGCPAKVEAKRQSDTMQIFDKYAKVSETRITKDSFSTRNIIIGMSLITIIAATLILKYKSK